MIQSRELHRGTTPNFEIASKRMRAVPLSAQAFQACSSFQNRNFLMHTTSRPRETIACSERTVWSNFSFVRQRNSVGNPPDSCQKISSHGGLGSNRIIVSVYKRHEGAILALANSQFTCNPRANAAAATSLPNPRIAAQECEMARRPRGSFASRATGKMWDI